MTGATGATLLLYAAPVPTASLWRPAITAALYLLPFSAGSSMLSAHCLEQSDGSDISAERHKSKAYELEMLLSERDADNGDSAQ